MTKPASPFIILASASKTRKQLLENAGVEVSVRPALVDEVELKQSLIESAANARDIADALADAKARSVAMVRPNDMVLGADQLLVQGGRLFSKAKSPDEARETLAALSDKKHQLVSAVVIYDHGRPVWRHVETATLSVRPLSAAFIDTYLEKLGDDAFWSVGCYQLEGLGIQLFDRIEGDHFTILGLPLIPVLDFLRRQGILPE